MSKEIAAIDGIVQVRDNLRALILKSGYGDFAEAIDKIVIKDYVVSNAKNISERAFQLAELIAFINRKKNKSVRLSEVEDVNNKYIVPDYATVSSYIMEECKQWATTLLNEHRGVLYEEAIGIPCKEIEDAGIPTYVESYSAEELADILSFEREMQEVRQIYSPRTKYAGRDEFRNPYYGRILKIWYDKFAEIGMFKSAQHVARGGAQRKGYRQECEFLHDCMVVIGLFNPIDVGCTDDEKPFTGDKYDKVKNRINSYEKHILKEKGNRKSR